ncbi:MAG: hypothetical protein A2Y10_01370 [Planctomycetes bacterium GWF2_41_51]|nr:MAG: hypothetical protein A2Y10_01370 [Planctomycetes bacterium GWF2_41_51]HBG26723.1 hypothetical protein [Phycisphaerales bacterium]
MRRVALFLLFIVTIPLTSLADLSYDYSTYAFVGYKVGSTYQTLSDSQFNKTASAYKSSSPYRAGSQAYPLSTPNQFGTAGIFWPRANSNDGVWAWAEMIGTITVDDSIANAQLNIQYEAANKPSDIQPSNASYYMAIGKNDFSTILFECSSFGTASFSLPVNGGDRFDYYLYYSIGSEYQPVYNSSLFVTGTIATFTLIPEPTTISLLGLGLLALRRKK